MRVGILSDIHSNLPALLAVLSDMGAVDELWCLGDMVGYGPHPNQVLELLRNLECRAIPGNHDLGSLQKISLADFNSDARYACQWTSEVLSEENRQFLEGLPLTRTLGDFTLVHGTPQEPVWEYMAYPATAKLSFQYFASRHCLVGHTHVPLVFSEQTATNPESLVPTPSAPLQLSGPRTIVNPGSVGQPRDGNPEAAYAIYDADHALMEFHRVPYDVQRTQSDMQQLQFPERLIKRLAYGW